MHIQITDGTDKRFQALCMALDEYLNEIVGGEKQREQYMKYNLLDDIHDVILILDDDRAVGCGSFKRYTDEIAEIKRVFVHKDYRGKKYGCVIMQNIEELAKKKGYKKLILETGEILVSAMKLYEHLGYQRIPNYGQYKYMQESICMEKLL